MTWWKKIAGVVVISLMVAVGRVSAEESTPPAHLPLPLEWAKSAFQQDYPQLPVASISTTPISGVFEVVLAEQPLIVYYAPASGHLLIGEIRDKTGYNLTAARQQMLQAQQVKALPLEQALALGNGPQQVIEFVDPDCPFCRRMEAFFAERTAITRYIFFLPLTQIHPQAAQKVMHILCSDNPKKAYHTVLAGKLDAQPPVPSPACYAAKGPLLQKHLQIARQLGVRGTPTFWIGGVRVDGADTARVSQLLEQQAKKGGK